MLPNTISTVQTGISAADIGARISANGRYVAFSSNQTLLGSDTVAGDGDIYLYDLQNKVLTLASTGQAGMLDSVKTGATLNGDGSLVAFQSTQNGHASILLKNMLTGGLSSVSTDGAGVEANGQSYNAVLSSNGRYVGFLSKATNLAGADGNGHDDLFVKNLATGAVVNASTAADGTQANAPSADSALSGDGRVAVFTTYATNLAAGDDNFADIYSKNLDTGTITRVSTDSGGHAANGNSDNASASEDGRYIAFTSQASNLVEGDSNGHRDVFRKDMHTGAVLRVSISADAVEGNGDSSNATISADGRFVMFESTADLTPGDGDGRADIFIKDVNTGALTRLSSGGDSSHFNYASGSALSANGLSAVFASYQGGNINDARTISLANVGADFGTLASATLTGTSGNDLLLGGQGFDMLTGGAGNDVLDGGGGRDLAVYAGARANFTVNIGASGTTVADKTGAEGTDAVGNIERMQFADGNIALDINSHGGQVYRLYQAAFDRAPDLPGQGFWIWHMDNGKSLATVADLFLTSVEGQALYGSAPNNTELLTRFYANVLHRAPDAPGMAFWTELMAKGMTAGQVLAGFSESPENVANVAAVIEHGIWYTPYG
jgi:Tol biopolymer transport system component